ncbi:MAG: InlB B-repeat-containing protein [Acholeplasmataceae bacterium]
MRKILKYFGLILGLSLLAVLASCDPKLYVVEFELNGGSPQIPDKTFRIGDRIEEVENPTREGHTFDGWWVDKNFTTKFQFNQKVGKDMTIYAKWKINSYTIDFVTNGGTEVGSVKYEFDFEITAPTEPTKEGYLFGGWYSDLELENEFTFDKMPAKNLILFAKWNPEEYEVRFLRTKDGELYEELTQFVPNQDKLTKPDNPTRVGFTFENWYINDEELYDFNKKVTKPIILYAKWIINQYTVSYNTGDGGSSLESDTYNFNAAIIRPTNPTKLGYRFVKWTLDGEDFVFDDKKMPANNLELVAEWIPNDYAISFNKNNNKVISGGVESISTTYDVDVVIPNHNYEVDGYTFVSWNSKSDGTGTNYLVGETYRNFTGEHLGTVELFAKWAANEYTINFDGNTGIGEMESVTAYYDQSTNLPANTFSKTGYGFSGWNFNGIIYNDKDAITSLATDGSVTLVAQWSANQYQVVFNSGDGQTSNQSFVYDEPKALNNNTFIKTGYTFDGWALTSDGVKKYNNGESVSNLTNVKNGTFNLYAVWSANTYTVHFSAGAGSGEMEPQTLTYDKSQNLSLNGFSKTGYKFANWKLDTDTYTNGQEVTNLATSGSVTLIAEWAPITYQVVFDNNGGAGSMNAQSFTYDSGQQLSPNEFTKVGYTFDGWHFDGLVYQDEALVNNLTTINEADVTFVANWKPNNYKVLFNSNSGSGTMTAQSFTYDVSQALKANTFTKTGYEIAGWALTADGNKKYNNEESVKNLTAVKDGEVTLYAVWAANTYTVNFDANGGTEEMLPQTFTYDKPQNLSLNTFAKTGYEFAGWKLDTTTYNDGQSVSNLTTSGSVTLVAQWTPITYQVVFDNNGGAGSMNAQPFTYDSDQHLLPNEFTKEGYTFGGWALTADGVKKYGNGETVKNLTSVKNDEVTLYAVWTANTYTVNFDGNDSTSGTMMAQSFTYDKPQNLSLNTFARTGYEFANWKLDTTTYNDGQSVSNLTTSGSVTLVAQWTPNNYSVLFDNNGGSGEMTAQSYVYDVTQALKANTFTKEGYTFSGWSLTAGGALAHDDKAPVKNLTSVKDGEVTLYAVWTANTYTVNFSANGGTGSMTAQSFTYDVAQNLKLNGFSKTGYTFANWKLDTTTYSDGQKVSNLATSGSVTLVAQWTPNNYSVLFNNNGGSGEMTAQPYVYDVTQALKENTFTKEGYTFSGWATTQGGGVAHSDKAPVKNLTSVKDGEVTLYAVWTPNNYSVLFNNNDGSGEMTAQSYVYDVTQALKANTFTKTGYTFGGWALTAGGAKKYGNGESVKNLTSVKDGEVTLYAVWTANTYTVNFSANGGTGSMTAQSFTYDVAQNLKLNDFNKTGYTFVNWKLDTTTYSDGQEVSNLATSGSVTLVAQWTPNNYSVLFDNNGGSGEMTAQSYVYDVTQALKANTFTKEGYTFSGWSLTAGGALAHDDKAPVKNLTSVKDGEVTLYAVWTANTYTVNFSANGGTGSMTAQSFTYDVAQNLKLNGFNKTGYTFANWKLDTTTYNDGQSVSNLTTSGSVTLVAQWTPNNYSVLFNNNGGSGEMTAQPYVYDVTQALKANTFTKEGYTFSGWATTQGGGVAHSDKAPVKNLTSVKDGEVTLYAVWTAITYTVQFDGNGSTSGTMNDFLATYDVTHAFPTNNYLRTGHDFIGWSTTTNVADKITNIHNLANTTGTTVTIYALWEINSYDLTIKYHDGATPEDDTPDKVTPYNFDAAITFEPAPVVEGKIFNGWIDETTNEPFDFTGARMPARDLIIGATYQDEIYITFDSKGGTPVQRLSGAAGSPVSAPTPPTRLGYTFINWFLPGGENAYEFTVMPDESINLEARWTANNYSVLFNNNGGSGEMTAQSYVYDVTQALKANTFIKTGYTFVGWALTADGTKKYNNEESVKNLTSVKDGEVTLYAVWQINKYNVTFNTNGGNATPATPGHSNIEYGATFKLNKNQFTRTGYQFAGWSKLQTGEYQYTDEQNVSNLTTENITVTLYAIWTPNNYSVLFNSNGGSGEMTAQPYVYDVTQALKANTFTKEGYTFSGWSLTAGGALAHDDKAPVKNLTSVKDGEVTLYAVWTANTYTVNFSANGGTGSMTAQSFTYDVAQNLKLNGFNKTGYTFANWKLDTTTYSDGQEVSNLATSGSVTLVAQWTPNNYNVLFNNNGGSGEMTAQPYVYDVTQALKENTFTKEGYTFSGWATTQGGGVTHPDKAPVKNLTSVKDGEVTLYAVWTPNNYSVLFNNNDGSGEMTAQSYVYDVTQALKANTFTKTGYTFGGWALTAGGAKKYGNGESVKNLTSVKDGEVTLYAVWTANTYTVNFSANGGTGSMTAQSFTYDVAQNLKLNDFNKTGYTFANWKLDTTTYSDGQKVSNLTTSGSVTLVAQWTPNNYSVLFDNNGGSGEMTAQPYVYDVTQALKANTFTKEGYTFSGWSLTAGGALAHDDKAPVKNLTSVKDGEVTLYAVWTANTYTVNFSANGGTGSMTAQSFTYDVAQNLKLNGFSKTGYTFANWELDTTTYSDGQKVSNLATSGSVTLVAQWTPNNYSVLFNNNGGSGEMTAQPYVYDVTQALKENTFTKEGYTFSGWATTQGGGVAHSDKAPVKNLTSVKDGEVTLYAVWTPNNYSVLFNNNDGSGEMTAQSYVYDVTQALKANTFTKEGYTFDGWALTAGGVKKYGNGESVKNLTSVKDGEVTLYAVWTANTYTVNFSANGGTGSMTAQSFTYDVAQNLKLNGFNKTGYTFANWKLDTTTYSDGQKVSNLTTSGSVTLVAQWTPNNYSVLFNNNGGSGEMTAQPYVYDVTQALKENTFTKEGYTFSGWATTQGGGVTHPDKAPVKNLTSVKDGEVTLYAVWTPNNYSVLFNNNDGSGEMTAQPYVYDVTQALKANTFTKTGYTFGGWALTAGGAKKYGNGESVKNLTSVKDGEVTLYAVWTANTYTVNFSANGGTGSMTAQSFTYDVAQNLKLNGFNKTGYTFANWKLDTTTYSDGQKVSNLTTSGSVTLVAQWTPNNYSVLFNNNGGSGEMTAQPYVYDVTQALKENTFTKEGYTFSGWATTQGGGVAHPDKAPVKNLTSVKDGEVTLYAVWTPNNYSVLFNNNGGSGEMTAQSYVYDVTQALKANTFTKTGYTFGGWALTAGGAKKYGNGESVKNLTSVKDGEVTLYAVWTANTYTVKFDGNGSTSGTMDNFLATYDVTHAFPTNNYLRTGHDFIGWSTTTNVADKITNIYNLTSTNGATFTIYALWEIQKFDIRFEFEFGRDPIHFSNVNYGTQLSTLELPPLDLVGHQFMGWKHDGVIVDLSTIHASSDMTFVASYQPKQYNVVFLIDGTTTYSLTDQTYGTEISFDNYVAMLEDDHLFVNGVENPETGEQNGIYTELQLFMAGTSNALVTTLNTPAKMTRWQTLCPASYPYATALRDVIPTGHTGNISNAATALNNVLNSESTDIQNRYLIYHNNNNKPIKPGFVFIGWVLGSDTQYGTNVEGDLFYVPNQSFGYSPAALIEDENAKIVAKWTSLQTIKDTDITIDGGVSNKINWPAANTNLIEEGLKLGETLELRYELYNIISDTEKYLIDDDISTNSYTFLTPSTWSVPGTYHFKVIAKATIKDSSDNVIRVFKSSFADNAYEYILQISGTNLEVTGEGDYYFKGNDPAYPDGETFYFYTNLTYNFKHTESFTLVLANGDPAPAGTYDSVVILGNSPQGGTNNSFVTQSSTGNFYFKRGDTVYFTRVLPYVASFHFGENLENYTSNKNNTTNPIFRGISKDTDYRSQITYQIGKKNPLMTEVGGLADYDENGFKFDLTVRTSGGNKIDPYVYDDYFEYEYFKHNGTDYEPIATALMADPVSSDGVWKFTAEEGKYKVSIKIKNTYVAPILRPNIVPLELEFTLNKGANVFTHNVLRKVYATTSLKDGINLHANIVASLAPEQRYTPEAVAAGNPFLQYAVDEALRSGNEDDFPGGSAVNVSFKKIILAANINKAYLTGNVYIRASLTDLEEDYYINGNLFTIDATQLTRSSIRSIGNLSKLVDTYKIVNQQASIFAYVSTNLETKYSQSTLHIKDMLIKGNTTNSKLDSSSQAELQNSIELMNRNSGGHVAVQAVYGSNVNITNTAIMNSTIALTMNSGYGKAVLKTVYTQSCWANSIYLHNGGEFELINTLLKDSGGAAIHAEDIYSTPGTPSPHKVTIDDLSEIDNFVSGEEGYFKAYAMEFTVMTMKSQMELAVNPQGLTVIKLVTDPTTGLQTEKVNFKFLFVPAGANAGPSGRQEAVTKYYVNEPGTIPGTSYPYPAYYDIYVINEYNPTGQALILPVNEIIILRKDNIPGYGPSLIGVGIYPLVP